VTDIPSSSNFLLAILLLYVMGLIAQQSVGVFVKDAVFSLWIHNKQALQSDGISSKY